jgi:regulatory protein
MIVDDKLMKYVIFKKRTEKEVRQKCQKLQYTEEYIEEIIEYLTENNYINDKVYVEKYIQNTIRLKTSSIYEMKIDLLRRGIDEYYIEDYINQNNIELEEYEQESAVKLAKKKSASSENEKIRKYLQSKGYKYDSISMAIDNLKEMKDNI